ncbi:MAG TPA: DUF4097 family beta strand repeat-containing protein [Vicinamibacterales bacterium]|nr:DUF4097 family beta strand repeat-containing protein [Vicinamibacterales bacterium]
MKLPYLLTAALALVPAFAPSTSSSAVQPSQRNAEWCSESSYGDDRARHNEVRNFAVPASGATINVDASPNGGIRVEGESRGDVQVQACVSATAEGEAQARALAQRVEVVATAEKVSANGPENLNRREGWSVSFRLTVPNRTSLSLRTTNGGISLTDVDGEIDFRTVNGGVSLTRIAGNVRGRTSNGGVTVDLDGSTWNGQGLEVETQNGGVTLAIPANYSARLETGTVNGRMNVDFPVTVQGRIGRTIDTQLGSGGPLIKVRTSNGGVNVRRK